ncbi:MAG: hypothetical protein EOM12_18090 [Verrucomicrobiae bacterium]|nr:hypothetical protein [Verrucomicrobiae bacterium]
MKGRIPTSKRGERMNALLASIKIPQINPLCQPKLFLILFKAKTAFVVLIAGNVVLTVWILPYTISARYAKVSFARNAVNVFADFGQVHGSKQALPGNGFLSMPNSN